MKVFRTDDNEIVDDIGNRTNETVVNSFKNNKSRNSTYVINIKAIEKPIFLIFNVKKIFNYFGQAFIKTLIS